MRTRTLIGQGTVTLLAALWALPSWSAAVSGQGTWETTLEARYFDTDATPDAYYDTDLNITWLADANYARTSGYDGDGLMTWSSANTWATTLNVDGVTGWRLPSVTDIGTPGCSGGPYSGGDCTWNVSTSTGEMAQMFHVTLGNLSQRDSAGNFRPGSAGVDWGLANTGPFLNVQAQHYWSSLEYQLDPALAWYFRLLDGVQSANWKTNSFYAWAVHSGDVGAATPVPVPAAAWLLGSGLLGLAGVGRRRLSTRALATR